MGSRNNSFRRVSQPARSPTGASTSYSFRIWSECPSVEAYWEEPLLYLWRLMLNQQP